MLNSVFLGARVRVLLPDARPPPVPVGPSLSVRPPVLRFVEMGIWGLREVVVFLSPPSVFPSDGEGVGVAEGESGWDACQVGHEHKRGGREVSGLGVCGLP